MESATAGRRVELRVPVSEGDHVRGAREARITLVEYGAFDCEASTEIYPLVRRLLERFELDLRFVFRHGPRDAAQARGRRAALAAEAAGLQDRFWAMHDLLFERTPALEPAELGACARELGLDEERLFRDMRTAAVSRRVREDQLGALKSGLRETPTFFLNEARWTGAFEFDALSQAISRSAATSAVPVAFDVETGAATSTPRTGPRCSERAGSTWGVRASGRS